MSIAQGGNGFPFFARPVFDYITTGKYTNINLPTNDIPNMDLKVLVEKVHIIP